MVARTLSGNSRGTHSETINASSTSVVSGKSESSISKAGNNSSNEQSSDQHLHIRVSQYPKIDQAIMNMKASLGRFTRANDRRMVLRTLKEVKYLRALPVEPRPPPMVDLGELEMEVAKENLVLNGQTFQKKTKFGRTATDFLHVLHELCYQLCENAACPSIVGMSSANGTASSIAASTMTSSSALTLSPDTLYYDILCRLARTIISADCFMKLNDVLGSNDLILMNADAERKPKAKKGKIAHESSVPPIEINIFEEGGNIHAHIVTTLGYGLYRKMDVNTGRPWIKMQAELSERSNFSTGAQIRHVTIHWPDMYV